jgi:hypothetical protein
LILLADTIREKDIASIQFALRNLFRMTKLTTTQEVLDDLRGIGRNLYVNSIINLLNLLSESL